MFSHSESSLGYVFSSGFSDDACISNMWTIHSLYNWRRTDLQSRPFHMSCFHSFTLGSLSRGKYQRSETRCSCHLSLHGQEIAQLKNILFYFPSGLISVSSWLFSPSRCHLFLPFVWNLVHTMVYSGCSSWGLLAPSLGEAQTFIR